MSWYRALSVKVKNLNTTKVRDQEAVIVSNKNSIKFRRNSKKLKYESNEDMFRLGMNEDEIIQSKLNAENK